MPPDLAEQVTAIRAFNRFYTRRIGVLDEAHMGSGFTLGEGRALYELAQADGITATALGEILDLDAGYLSRVLRRFEDNGLLERRPDPKDGRSTRLHLTDIGRNEFIRLDRMSAQQVAAMIAPLAPDERLKLDAAMATVRDALGATETHPAPAAVTLRGLEPGDMGWVVERHAVIYGREYGWGRLFEAEVAGMAANILRALDDPGARAWIAEMAGRRVGSVFMVREAGDIARLRLLLLEPEARGQRLGQRLVDECLAFARAAGYREVVLWTHTELTAARAIYASRGFELIETHFHSDFGPEVQSETWRLVL
ncbi:MAG TPA: bifunctional helix-turn-helix transcriptional regulator/GNAT family N-acetyltransferase [Caulobacteraceae bacterium]